MGFLKPSKTGKLSVYSKLQVFQLQLGGFYSDTNTIAVSYDCNQKEANAQVVSVCPLQIYKEDQTHSFKRTSATFSEWDNGTQATTLQDVDIYYTSPYLSAYANQIFLPDNEIVTLPKYMRAYVFYIKLT